MPHQNQSPEHSWNGRNTAAECVDRPTACRKSAMRSIHMTHFSLAEPPGSILVSGLCLVSRASPFVTGFQASQKS